MSKEKLKIKIDKPQVKEKIEPELEEKKTDSEKNDLNMHPKFDKFKPQGETEK